MNLNVVREFVVLAEELNYTSASQKLYISRSSLTKHIQSLETEIGVDLLFRNTKSVVLTDAGKNFFLKSKDLLNCYRDAIDSTLAIAEREEREIKVGYLFETAMNFLPQACVDYSRNHSSRLLLRAMEVEDIRHKVCSNEIDLGLTTLVLGEVSNDFKILELEKDSFGVIVVASSALADCEQISLKDLNGITICGPDYHYLPAETRAVERYLSKSASSVNLISTISDIGSIKPALTMGAQAVLSVGHIAKRFGSEFVFIPFADMDESPSVALIWKESRESEELLALVDCIYNSFLAIKKQ